MKTSVSMKKIYDQWRALVLQEGSKPLYLEDAKPQLKPRQSIINKSIHLGNGDQLRIGSDVIVYNGKKFRPVVDAPLVPNFSPKITQVVVGDAPWEGRLAIFLKTDSSLVNSQLPKKGMENWYIEGLLNALRTGSPMRGAKVLKFEPVS